MKYGTGANESPYDIRTFAYVPSGVPKKGGKRYLAKDIQHQHKVGICTAIATTQNASKAVGKRFSAEFQYLMQKKLYDKNWTEGSSLSSALKVARNIGFLPEKFWTFTTEDDRKLSYAKYIAKLQKVTDAQIEELKVLASPYKIQAYASVPVDHDLMAQAINESDAGILTRYALGNEWWTGQIEPLRPPKVFISGHAVTDSNYDGGSFRIANSWGTDWADKGTAYRIHNDYRPTEAWIVHYGEVPEVVEKQLASRKKILGSILNGLQEIIKLYQKLK
jgi:hypothetical protein